MAFWAFLPLFLGRGPEKHEDMELIGIVFIILIVGAVAATISGLRKDGWGHTPPVRSENDWTALDLPSVNYTLRMF
jgi:hypothetical protein